MSNKSKSNRRKKERTTFVYIAFLLIMMVLIVGVSGYMIFEGFSPLEALYMTVITVTTVGFGELHELTSAGRVFTIFLIISSLGTFTYAISKVTSHFIEGQIGNILGKYGKKTRKAMKNHVIVVGYGRNGRQTISELLTHNNQCFVIDNNHDIVIENKEKGISFYEGDATEDETLMAVGIKNAKALIATLPTDADNLYIVLTARALNPNLTIISRASSESAERKLRIAGVDRIVMPEKVGGAHMAKLVARSDIVEFLDYLSVRGSAPTTIQEIECRNIHEDYKNKSLQELEIRKKTGANIIGFKDPQGQYIINPTASTKLQTNSKLFVLGTKVQIEKMKSILSKSYTE